MHRVWLLASLWGVAVTVIAETTTTALPPCDINGTASSDITVRNGSTFEMTCLLTRWPGNEHYEIGMLRSRYDVVPASQIRRHNATSATWTRPNVQASDSGTYYCSVKGSACESVFSATALLVGYAPLEPFSEGCSGDHFETFQCSWRTQDHYIRTRHEVILRVGNSGVYSLIPCNMTDQIESQDLTCRLTTSGKTIYRIEEPALHFEVIASNAYGTAKWTYAVDHFAHVKLPAPSLLGCHSETDKMSISWTSSPKISTFPDILYEVRLRYNSKEEREITINNSDKVVVGGLIPNTVYNVSVRMKFARASAELWSFYSDTLQCKTKKTIPTALPKVAENGFMIQDFKDTRKVRLFYQRVAKSLWNGDRMSYVLHWCSSRGECASHKVTGERTHVDLFNLSRVENYTFQLFSENDVGRSLRSVNVLLPSSDQVMPSVQDAYVSEVKILNPTFTLAPRTMSDKVLHYTLFWCRGVDDEMGACENDVSWATVKSSGDAWSAASCAMSGRCKYGVATRSAEAVSAMTWIDCVLPNSREYQDLMRGEDSVHYDEITDTSVQVTFLTKCAGLVASRIIRFCALRGPEEALLGNNTVPESEFEECTNSAAGPEKTVLLRNLYPETTYQVTITTVMEDGMSIRHRPVRIRTQGRGPTALATAAVVVAALLVALTVVAAIFWRRISVYIEEYKNTTVKVLIPAEFTKESIKKSDSIRSNLREYVLNNKNSPYGIAHVLRSQNLQEQAENALSPEADCLLKDTRPGIPVLPERSLPTSDKYFNETPQQTPLLDTLSPGYSMVSSLQDKNSEPIGNAYSKFSALQDQETMQIPPLARGYSLFSSFALDNPDTKSIVKEPLTTDGTPGYSKFAPFLMEVDLRSTEKWNHGFNGQPWGRHERFSVPCEMPPSYVKVAGEVPSQPKESSQTYVKVRNEAFPLSKNHQSQSPETHEGLDKHQRYVKVGYEMSPCTKNGSNGTKKDDHQKDSSELEGVSDAYVKVGYDVQPAVLPESSDFCSSAASHIFSALPQEAPDAYVEAEHDVSPAQLQKPCDGGIKEAQNIPPPVTQGLSNAYVKVGYDVAPSNESQKSSQTENLSQQGKNVGNEFGEASTSDVPLVYSKVGMRAQNRDHLPENPAEFNKDVSLLQTPPLHMIFSDDEYQHGSPEGIMISEKGFLNPPLDFSILECPNYINAGLNSPDLEHSNDTCRCHPSGGYTTWAALAKPLKHGDNHYVRAVDVRPT